MSTGHTQGSEHALLAAVALAADRLLAPSDHLPLAPVLEAFGTAAGASRVALVAAHAVPGGAPRMEGRQQWVAAGVPRLQAGLDGWPAYPDRWRAELTGGRAVAVVASSVGPDERLLLDAVGARSALLVPLQAAGEWYGHLTCHDTLTARQWQPAEVDAAASIAAIVGQAIGQRRLAAHLEHRAGILRALGAGTTMLLEAPNWRHALPRVLDALRTATRARAAWAYGPDPDAPGRRLVLLYEVLAPGARSLGGRPRVVQLPPEATARLQVAGPIHSAQPADIREPIGGAVSQPGVPAWAVAPMVLAPGQVGLVGLDSDADRRWADGEAEGLELVASALKAAIRRGSQLAPIAIVPSPWGAPAAVPLPGSAYGGPPGPAAATPATPIPAPGAEAAPRADAAAPAGGDGSSRGDAPTRGEAPGGEGGGRS